MVKQITINESILLIVQSLLREKGHIRKIAQETGLNHVTVLNNMAILEGLKVVSYRYVGRSKEYELTGSKLAQGYVKLARQYAVMRE